MAVEPPSPAAETGHQTRFSYRRYWMSLYQRDVPAAEQFVEAVMRCWPAHPHLPAGLRAGSQPQRHPLGAGKITHADEHFITHHTLRFMRRVRLPRIPPEMEPASPLAVAAGVGTDSHQVGLRMVCDFLGWANWRVHWPTSNDRATIGDAVSRLRPDAVLLSVGTEAALDPAARLIADLRRREFGGLIAVGGGRSTPTPARAGRVGADLTAPNGAALVRALRPRFPSMKRRRGRGDDKVTR